MNLIKNMAASVRAKLLNISRKDNRPFEEVLQYYAMERFLYRLSLSEHSKCFILKGALMLRVWDFPEIRPTMDIDMLGVTDNEEQKLLYLKKNLIKNGSLLVLGFKADTNLIKIPNPGAPGSSPGRCIFLCLFCIT